MTLAALVWLASSGPWCLAPSAPAWVALVTWTAGDGAHCVGGTR